MLLTTPAPWCYGYGNIETKEVLQMSVQVNLSLPDELHAKIMAAKEGLSIQNFLEKVLRDYFKGKTK